MANNNGTSVTPVSFNVFSSMGYTLPQPSRGTIRTDQPVNKANMEGQNMVLKINNSDIKMNIDIPHLDADIYDKTPQDPLNFKDMSSFNMNVNNGILNLNGAELSATVKNVAAKETDLLKDIQINFVPGNRVNVDMKVHKFLNFKVKLEGSVTAQPVNNMIRVKPDKISVAGIPIKGILDLFHLQVGEIVKIGKPSGSFFSSGDSVYFSPTKLVDTPSIDGNVTDVKTGMGVISIMIGKDNVNTYKPKPLYGADNYLRLRGGDVDFSGFNLKDADVALLDQTPNDPFDMDSDPAKKVIAKGKVSIPDSFIATALKDKMGEGSSLKDMRFSMPDGVGKLKASMWGFLPISLDLNFGKSNNGMLKIVPDNGKVLGFIPLPDSLLRKTLVKETEGQIEGNGVTVDLNKLADLQTPNGIADVKTDKGKLILTM